MELFILMRFWRLGWFRRGFCSCEMGAWAVKWHSCAKGWFRNCKNFRRGELWGCKIISQWRAIFIANPWFRSRHLVAAKSFRSRWPFSQGAILGCIISQTTEISCFWASFGSLRPSFTSFVIPPKLDHSKTYVTSKQIKIKVLKSKLKQVIK